MSVLEIFDYLKFLYTELFSMSDEDVFRTAQLINSQSDFDALVVDRDQLAAHAPNFLRTIMEYALADYPNHISKGRLDILSVMTLVRLINRQSLTKVVVVLPKTIMAKIRPVNAEMN